MSERGLKPGRTWTHSDDMQALAVRGDNDGIRQVAMLQGRTDTAIRNRLWMLGQIASPKLQQAVFAAWGKKHHEIIAHELGVPANVVRQTARKLGLRIPRKTPPMKPPKEPKTGPSSTTAQPVPQRPTGYTAEQVQWAHDNLGDPQAVWVLRMHADGPLMVHN